MSAGTSDLRRETVKTKVASEALTEQAAQFINEGGRCASHLLFCEFIDNSLHAMAQRRAEAARGELLDDWIEVHLIYDYDTRGGARLTHVAILDRASANGHVSVAGLVASAPCALLHSCVGRVLTVC